MYALLAESLKHQHTIEELITSSGLKDHQPIIDPYLSKILIAELLWGKGYLRPENARPIRAILNIENCLRNALKGIDSNPIDEIEGRNLFFFLLLLCSCNHGEDTYKRL